MKYPDSVVNEVRDLYKQGKSTRQIAKLTHLGKSTVAGMTRGIQRVKQPKTVPKVFKGKKVKPVNKVKMVKKVIKEKEVKRVRLDLPADLWKQVSKAAIDQDVNKADLVKEALKKYLKI